MKQTDEIASGHEAELGLIPMSLCAHLYHGVGLVGRPRPTKRIPRAEVISMRVKR